MCSNDSFNPEIPALGAALCGPLQHMGLHRGQVEAQSVLPCSVHVPTLHRRGVPLLQPLHSLLRLRAGAYCPIRVKYMYIYLYLSIYMKLMN